MMKNKRLLCIIGFILFALFTTVILYNNIARVEYKYNSDDDCYEVGKVYGNAREYTIKSMHKGKKVESISKKAFSGKSNLKKINFPSKNYIYYIESAAFENCTNLTSFMFPKEIKYVEDNLFSGCKRLQSVIFEDGSKLENIGGSMFINCIKLKDIELPQGIKEIGTYAFFNCKSLEEITFPISVKQVYNDVFYNCDSLIKITFLGQMTELDPKWINNQDEYSKIVDNDTNAIVFLKN